MILHRPGGRGHPYRLDPDQRVPVVPVAGEPLELRATTRAGVERVRLEVERGGKVVIDAEPWEPVAETAAGGGHLAAAAAGVPARGRRAWRVRLDDLQGGERLRYRFVGDGATRWHDVAVAAWSATGGELRVTGPAGRLVPDSVSWLVAEGRPRRVRFALRLEPGERVVGFGERFNALDQRGGRIDAVVFEQYKRQGERTYLPMPFAHVVGGSGFGFYVATSRRVFFDVGAAEPDRLAVETDVDPERPELELDLYAGDPASVLARYLERTGPPKLPPDWIFQPWMSANEWNTQARVLAEVERGEREGIPVGVLVIEAWSDESTFVAFRDARYRVHADGAPHRLADFEFPADGAWPDPKGMVDELHRRGIRVLLWQIPLLKAKPEPGSQLSADRAALLSHGLAVRQADGNPYANRGWWFPRALLPDFTSAQARAWWLAKRRYLVEELGVDGFKTDGGEHAWGDDLRYADGTRGAETNNRYPLLYAAAYHELLGDAGITFSRAGFTGSAAYPCHWAGDEDSTWEAFRASILAGLTAGASGIFFWGWDLAGFSGEIPSAELYLRAAAAAALCPIMQYHSEFNHHRRPSRDRTPWNIAERTGDARVLPLFRRFAQLRTRLVPYLAEQARVSVTTARPLMRALFFDAPADERIWDHPYQYLLGDHVLVAPVVEPGASQWTCYLPAGDWIDAWTGEPFAGEREHVVAAPLDRIPCFLRRPRTQELRAAFATDTVGSS